MSREQRTIRREIEASNEELRGTMASELRQTFFRPAQLTAAVWVGDVIVNSNRVLRDVPVKINGQRARSYAAVGRPVILRRNARGRWQVIGPADRKVAQGKLVELDLDTDVSVAAGLTGFTTRREVFDFYKGNEPTSFFDPATDVDSLVWIDMTDPAVVTVVGGFITAVTDKGSLGSNLSSAGGAFDPAQILAAAGSNLLDSADFDGSNDELNFGTNIVESTAGQISIFCFVNKDSAGSLDDVVVQISEWEVRSRSSAGDRWFVSSGGAGADSGSTLGTTDVLIEVVARAFNDFDLYQDGVFLGTFTPIALGLGLGASELGNHTSFARPHNGRISEVLIIDRTVNDADRKNIEAYFATKYNTAFSRWNDGITPFPKTSIIGPDGSIIP